MKSTSLFYSPDDGSGLPTPTASPAPSRPPPTVHVVGDDGGDARVEDVYHSYREALPQQTGTTRPAVRRAASGYMSESATGGMALLRRGRRVTKGEVCAPLPVPPPRGVLARGVSLRFLGAWLKMHDTADGMTARQLLETVVKPATAAHKCDYAALLGDLTDADSTAVVAPPTHVLAHAWGSRLRDAFQGLQTYFETGWDDAARVYIWLDLLALDHHGSEFPLGDPAAEAALAQAVSEACAAAGQVLLFCHPWDKPTSLRRLWPLCVCVLALEANARFSMCATSGELAKFRAALEDRPEEIERTLGRLMRVRAQDAEEESAALGRMHRRWISRGKNGAAAANRLLSNAMQAWMADAGQRELLLLEAKYGPADARTVRTAEMVAHVLQQAGKMDAAEAVLRQALAGREGLAAAAAASSEGAAILIVDGATAPTDSVEVAVVLNNLASVLVAQNAKLPEALAHCARAVAIRTAAQGEQSAELAPVLHNLAVVYESLGRLDAAEATYKRCLSINETSHGLDHLFTAQTLINLAVLLHRRGGKDASARPMIQRAHGIQRKRLGDGHPAVAQTGKLVKVIMDVTRQRPRAAGGGPH